MDEAESTAPQSAPAPSTGATKTINAQLTNVKVHSPFRTYYDGPALSVSAQNATGPFDVLPGHKNFMSLLTPGEVIIRTKGGEEHIKIDSAILHVSGDLVKVFLDV